MQQFYLKQLHDNFDNAQSFIRQNGALCFHVCVLDVLHVTVVSEYESCVKCLKLCTQYTEPLMPVVATIWESYDSFQSENCQQ